MALPMCADCGDKRAARAKPKDASDKLCLDCAKKHMRSGECPICGSQVSSGDHSSCTYSDSSKDAVLVAS